MFRILSRVKTDGSFTSCPKMDTTCADYGNRIESNKEFNEIDVPIESRQRAKRSLPTEARGAVQYIQQYGNFGRIYYIVSPYQNAFDKDKRGDVQFDAGNEWFVRRRYVYMNGKWTRLCLTSKKTYEDAHRGRYEY